MKKKKWCRFRHRVVWVICTPIISFLTWIKSHAVIEPFKKGKKGQYLVLVNHQTVFDQFYIALSFARPIYFLATENIFSNGFLSTLLRFSVAPIPINKFATDLKAVKTCYQVVKEGGTIVIFPEGNSTHSGRTENMKSSIVTMARKFKLPIVFYKIRGGYGTKPRWADKWRKGRVFAGVSRIMEPAEYAGLTDEELFETIKRELYVNDHDIGGRYEGKSLAEHIERSMYVCPKCGLSVFESKGNRFWCTKCGQVTVLLPDLTFKGVDTPFTFKNGTEWYDYQQEFINSLEPAEFFDKPAYTDRVDVYKVIVNKKKQLLLKDVEIALYGNRMVVFGGDAQERVLSFDEMDGCAVIAANYLNVSCGGEVLQIRGSKSFNVVRFVNFYHRYKNSLKGDDNDKFLGL